MCGLGKDYVYQKVSWLNHCWLSILTIDCSGSFVVNTTIRFCGHYNKRWSVCTLSYRVKVRYSLFTFNVRFVQKLMNTSGIYIFLIYSRLILCHQTRVPNLRDLRQHNFTGGQKTNFYIFEIQHFLLLTFFSENGCQFEISLLTVSLYWYAR